MIDAKEAIEKLISLALINEHRFKMLKLEYLIVALKLFGLALTVRYFFVSHAY